MPRAGRGLLCSSIAAVALAATAATAQSSLPRVLVWAESLHGTAEQALRWPSAVASASVSEIVVTDAFEPRLLRFLRDGASWRLERAIPLTDPAAALVWDGSRYVAALRGRGGLVAFEPDQLLQRRIALPRGTVPGAMAARADGTLFLHDSAGARVLELGEGGRIARETAVEGRVAAIAAAPAGGFFLALGASGAVVRYDAGGERTAVWTLPGAGPVPCWPVALAVEPGGDLAIVDRHGGRVLFVDVAGKPIGLGSRRGWEPGLLRFPSAIARMADGRLVVADQGNGRLQIFRRADGTP